MYALHVQGTLNVLEAVARHAPAAPVVLLGSAAEYGVVPPEVLPVDEDCPPGALSFFGASKLAQTQAAQPAAVEWKIGVVVVRPFNIIGPGLPCQYFAAALAQRLLEAKATGASGDMPVANAEATRDFVDVRDVVEAISGLLTRAIPQPGELRVYNIASGRETRVGAIAEKLAALAGVRVVDAGTAQSRSSISRSCGDPSRLRKATGWTPQIAWEQSIEDLWRAIAPRGEGPPQR
jgi:GDP-4-dehydro-6-deoxy-D-mannose reductase